MTPAGYEEVAPLGDGATGRVFAARRISDGKLVAIKAMAPALSEDRAFRDLFRREAELLERVRHPNIVSLIEYRDEGASIFLVMELVDGIPLTAIIEQGAAREPEAALSILKGSLLGLDAAHALDIVHRDYKPGNVLVTTEGESRLLDFGVAVSSGDAGWRAGTPAYMAPEQWRADEVTAATDIYAAAAVFFHCLAGHPPFTETTVAALEKEHLNEPVPFTEIPAPLHELVRRGMAKDPAERWQSANEFVAVLEMAAQAAYGEDWEERGRKRLAAAVAALAALLPTAAVEAGTIGSTDVGLTILRVGAAALAVAGLLSAGIVGLAMAHIGPFAVSAPPVRSSPRATATSIPSLSPTPATTESVASTPSPSSSPSPSASPSPTPTPAPTPKPSATPSATPRPSPTPTPTPVPIAVTAVSDPTIGSCSVTTATPPATGQWVICPVSTTMQTNGVAGTITWSVNGAEATGGQSVPYSQTQPAVAVPAGQMSVVANGEITFPATPPPSPCRYSTAAVQTIHPNAVASKSVYFAGPGACIWAAP